MLARVGVGVKGLSVPMTKALRPINKVWKEVVGEHAIITSTYGSVHSDGSLHYRGDAVDFALKYANDRSYHHEVSTELVRRLRKELGDEFDIVFEADHLHIEYDPKEER